MDSYTLNGSLSHEDAVALGLDMAVWQTMKVFLASLVKAGTRHSANGNVQIGIVLTNIISLLFSTTVVFFGVVFASMGLHTVARYCAVFALILLPWIFCNHRGWIFAAKVGLVTVSNLGGLILCLMMGPEAEVHNGYLCVVGLSILLFEVKDRRNWFVPFVSFALSAGCYFFAEEVPFAIVPPAELTDAQTYEIRTITMLTYFFLVFFELYYLGWVNALLSAEKDKTQTALVASSRLASLGVMAGGVAHEINTPLGVIRARASHIQRILAKPPIDIPVALQFCKVIERTTDEIAGIVQSLRYLSRDATHDPYEKVDLRTIVNTTLDLCHERLTQGGVELVIDLPEKPILVHCRPTQVSQALLNLINNAHDATEGQPDKWVRISAAMTQQAAEISIIDSGPGIAPRLRELVFNPFFTTKEVGKGIGLGLSIAKTMIENNDGRLELDAVSPNTRFVIQLPQVSHLEALKAAV